MEGVMDWVFAGFGFAFGAWLFMVVLKWGKEHPLMVVNIALFAISAVALGVVLLAWLYAWWAGLMTMFLVAAGLQSIIGAKSEIIAPAREL